MDRGGGCSQNSRKSKVQNFKLGKFLELNGHGLSPLIFDSVHQQVTRLINRGLKMYMGCASLTCGDSGDRELKNAPWCAGRKLGPISF